MHLEHRTTTVHTAVLCERGHLHPGPTHHIDVYALHTDTRGRQVLMPHPPVQLLAPTLRPSVN